MERPVESRYRDGRLISFGILSTFRTAVEVACHGLGATRGRCGCREPRQRMLSKLLPPGRKAIRVQVPAWMRRRTSLAMQDLRGQLDQPFDTESCSRQKGRVECPLQSHTEQ